MYVSTGLLFFVFCGVLMVVIIYAAAVVLFQHRQIKSVCMVAMASIKCLQKAGNKPSEAFSAVERASFANLKEAYSLHIKPQTKHRDELIDMVNTICGSSYSLMDVHDCFENGRINDFYADLTRRSDKVFVNILYTAQLEQYGFESVDLVGIGKYL